MALPHEERHDVGVLFVHGIGRSRRGDTLARFGDAFVRWIDGWLAKADVTAEGVRPTARLGSAVLDPPRGVRDPPAHATLVLRHVPAMRTGVPETPTSRDVRCLLAEAWWAQSFPPPTYGELVTWAFKALPWT